MEELTTHYPFLADLTEAGRQTLASHARFQSIDARTPLLTRGDLIEGVFLVTEGALRVFHVHEDGRENTLYWVGAGDFCITALNCMFNGMNYPAWVSTDSPTRVAIVPGSVFRELFDRERAVRDFTVSTMSERIFELISTLADAVSLGVEQRLATLVLRKLDSNNVVSMSQDVIANHLGTAREVVSRQLRAWSARGFVRTHRGGFEVLDRAALSALLPAPD